MAFSLVNILPDYLIKALGNTLIHSLWQGMLLAVVTGLIVIGTRKASASKRYNLLIAALLLFTVTVAFTFAQELKAAQSSLAIIGKNSLVIHNALPSYPSVVTEPSEYRNILSFLSSYSNIIVLIWFLIVLARSLQLLTGLQVIYHLRRRQIFSIDNSWQHRVTELAGQMGIRQIITIAESGIARVPMVVGHLKPLILIPVGLITALSPADIEAILVHELAHICRRDYLTNVLLSIVELLFFFNPAVLWIAALIKAERENCCDDIAVEYTGNKVNYIKALVASQEYQLSAPAFAMALNGNKQHLKGRVQRLLSSRNPSLNMMERSLLAVCLVTAVLLTTAFTQKDNIEHFVTKTSKTVARVSQAILQKKDIDTAVKKTTTIITESRMSVIETVTSKVKDTTQKRVNKPDETGDPLSLNNLAAQTALADSLKSLQGGLSPLSSVKQKLGPVNTKLSYQNQYTLYNLDSAKRYQAYTNNYRSRKTGYDRTLSAENPSTNAVPVLMKNNDEQEPDITRQVLKAIISEGLAAKVQSYKLTEYDLVINGEKLPDETFKRFKNNYIRSFEKRSIVYYNYDTSTKVTTTTTL
ncbi:hypothetical protein GCM10023149_02360 [Mucilaginibacter gynuensis]|uniref:Peptidase M56 domain-containing protein n=1 Tax=Mucilaginibacter gynuensis TaxID=1302236 RepID=A0ABP8FQ14_9SPHI